LSKAHWGALLEALQATLGPALYDEAKMKGWNVISMGVRIAAKLPCRIADLSAGSRDYDKCR
jgi:hypothetical protein